MKEKIAVLFGGVSVEHDISIITAVQTMKFLPNEYDFLPIYIDKEGKWWIAENLSDVHIYQNFHKQAKKKKQVSFVLGTDVLLVKKSDKFVHFCKISTVINCCHGHIGEDGCVQGLFDCCDIAQTSCDVTSSAICMDKVFMKNILQANEISTPKYYHLRRCEYEKMKQEKIREIEKRVGYPLIVKPANLGSSIGISICENSQNLSQALELAFEFDEKVIVEVLVQNLKEFNCACFSYRGSLVTSTVNEVKNKTNIFTFEDKYLASKSENKDAERNLARKIKTLTEKVYKIFDCKGVVRVDFLYDEEAKEIYVNEINSIPGSLSCYLFKDLPSKELLRALIEESFSVRDERRRLLKTFESDALKIFEEVKVEPKK